MDILLIEDDHKQRDLIRARVEAFIAGASVRTIATERQFRQQLASIAENPPDIVICDVRLRWTSPPDIDDPPPECADFSLAGLRCRELLHSNPSTANLPIILYTVQEFEDMERHLQGLGPRAKLVTKLAKTEELESLAKAIRSFLPDAPTHGD